MKVPAAFGALCVLATAAAMSFPSQAQPLRTALSASGPNDKIASVILDNTHPTFAKLSAATYVKSWVAEFTVAKDAKVASKKFTLGGADANEGTATIDKLSEADCKRYVLSIKVLKKGAAGFDQIFQNSIHGDWFHSNLPGTFDHCKLKDGWGTAPTLWSGTLTLPTAATPDVYRVEVEAGLTKESWPNNAKSAIVTRRKVKVTMTMVP